MRTCVRYNRTVEVDMEERVALLAILLGTKMSWTQVGTLVDDLGSAHALFSQLQGDSNRLFTEGDELQEAVSTAEVLLARWSQAGIHFATFLEPEFPSQLLTIHQRPPFVTWKGSQSSQDSCGVAIVGTRAASAEGVRCARQLASEMASRGVTVISGLAAGIDTAAHLGALDANGRTVAVIGTGLMRSYPKQNTALQARVATSGMVLSQFLPDAAPTKFSFPMRNAVMSGFSSATVVIEADWKSGARMQARLALEHGRQVFLMDQLRQHDWAREYGERPGAHFVSSVDEILSLLDRSSLGTGQLVDS